MRFTSKDEKGNKLIDLPDTRGDNELYSSSTFILPVSISGKYIFNNNIVIQAGIKWLSPQTDYIDNISEFGNEEGKDKIMQYNISIGYPLSKKK